MVSRIKRFSKNRNGNKYENKWDETAFIQNSVNLYLETLWKCHCRNNNLLGEIYIAKELEY